MIHIAGTNGKGSTLFYLEKILREVVQLRTGSFTSPHLIEKRDSCKVENETIDERIWQEAGERINEEDDYDAPCTEFERLTAQSLLSFSLLPLQKRPEILVIEVGLGGKDDATNVFDERRQVLASVITAIDFDHEAILGRTLGEIAKHKAGIIKPEGLCILQDQRRGSVAAKEEIDNTQSRVASSLVESPAEGIERVVREKCSEANARLVKSYTPWQVLHQEATSNYDKDDDAWKVFTDSNIRFCPILYPSKTSKGDFSAKSGDSVIPGPQIRLTPTKAALLGTHLAMQTLWSIARDDPPSEMGQYGADEYEEIRLKIAFALRQDDSELVEMIRQSLSSSSFPGRAEWRQIKPGNDGSTILALVDGAHNPSAAIALREYVDSCIQAKGEKALPVEITWIIAFSKGKSIEGMLQAILSGREAAVVSHRFACIPFTTPVEGMPWIDCIAPEEILKTIKEVGNAKVKEVEAFSNLSEAIHWASKSGNGIASTDGSHSNMMVIAGSLYLVSDVHRFQSSSAL